MPPLSPGEVELAVSQLECGRRRALGEVLWPEPSAPSLVIGCASVRNFAIAHDDGEFWFIGPSPALICTLNHGLALEACQKAFDRNPNDDPGEGRSAGYSVDRKVRRSDRKRGRLDTQADPTGAGYPSEASNLTAFRVIPATYNRLACAGLSYDPNGFVSRETALADVIVSL